MTLTNKHIFPFLVETKKQKKEKLEQMEKVSLD